MSILITGMDIPEFGEKIIILTSSGYVEDVSGQVIDGVEAVPVPAHGKLNDADSLVNELVHSEFFSMSDYNNFVGLVLKAPTIIPASGGKEDE